MSEAEKVQPIEVKEGVLLDAEGNELLYPSSNKADRSGTYSGVRVFHLNGGGLLGVALAVALPFFLITGFVALAGITFFWLLASFLLNLFNRSRRGF